MAALPNTTTTGQFTGLTIKEIDFISRFERNWQALIEILGIMRPIAKVPGTKLVSSKASIVLQSGTVAEGDEVPLSQAKVEPVAFADLTLKKYRKAVTVEAVDKYGAAIAVQKTDDALLNELQGEVLDSFYEFAQTGTLTGTYATFQMAVAMAVAKCKNKFKTMRRDYSNIVAFVNTLDLGEYLGGAPISIQTSYGLEYLKNFLGADTVIITSEIPQGTVLATPAENIVLYYCDPSNADFRELGLEYTTGNGETNLIGIHKEGNYGRVMGETHALMGMVLWAEYLDGIANITIDANPLKGATVAPLASDSTIYNHTVGDLQEDVKVTKGAISGKLIYTTEGELPDYWGPGYWLALQFSGWDASATSVKIGLVPSEGSGLVEIINDDGKAAIKITDTEQQLLTVVVTDGTKTTKQTFDLSGLRFVQPEA